MQKRRKYLREYKQEPGYLTREPGVSVVPIARDLGFNAHLVGRVARNRHLTGRINTIHDKMTAFSEAVESSASFGMRPQDALEIVHRNG